MTFVPTAPCPRCGLKVRARFDTDGSGGLVETLDPCPECTKPKKRRAWTLSVDKARRLACICQRCPRPVDGKPKVALYCERHRKERRKESQRKHLAKVWNKHAAAYRERHRKKLRRKARQQARKDRERRCEYKRQWRKENRDKVKMQKRRYALRGKAAEQMRRHRERIKAGEHSPRRSRWTEDGQRLCLRRGCPHVLTGRAKLCDTHRAGRSVPRETMRRAA